MLTRDCALRFARELKILTAQRARQSRGVAHGVHQVHSGHPGVSWWPCGTRSLHLAHATLHSHVPLDRSSYFVCVGLDTKVSYSHGVSIFLMDDLHRVKPGSARGGRGQKAFLSNFHWQYQSSFLGGHFTRCPCTSIQVETVA